jgi:hypothetical protein
MKGAEGKSWIPSRALYLPFLLGQRRTQSLYLSAHGISFQLPLRFEGGEERVIMI